jgi:choline-sulfatase
LLTAASLNLLKSSAAARAVESRARFFTQSPTPFERPNILILMVDEQRYPPVYESPALRHFRRTYLLTQEQLRQRGVEFHRHYAASVACAPSRTSLYTGHYPSLHGVTNTDGAAKSADEPEMFWLDPNTVPTLGDYFSTAGYRTFWKGKWHISHVDIELPGTHESLASYDDSGNRDPEKEAIYLAGKRLEDYGFSGWVGPEPHGNNPLNSGGSAGGGKKGRDEAIAGQTIELLEQLQSSQSDQPWLLVSSFVNPHDIAMWGFFSNLGERLGLFDFSVGPQVPHDLFDQVHFARTRNDNLSQKPSCQKSYRDSYRRFFQPTFETPDYYRFYYQAHQNVDRQLARVYQAFKQTRFFQNTIVVFTSDHGDLLGAHNGMHQKWYQTYDEALRVPLIISNPVLFPVPEERDHLSSHVDVLPTLLGLCGIDAEAVRRELAGTHTDARPLVGKDLTRFVLDREAAPLDEAVYFMTDDDPSRGQNQENFIGISYDSVVQPNHIECTVTRLGGKLWKCTRYFDNPQFWTDPGQPGRPGVKDVVVKPAGLAPDLPGVYLVPYQKRVKRVPQPEEFELYNLTDDPMELENLAGRAQHAPTEAILRRVLEEQSKTKRLTPTAPGTQRLPTIPEPPPVPFLLTEENSERAVALNAVTQTRDPFFVVTRNNLSEDQRTRIMLFAMNVELLPDEDSSVLTAQAETAERGTVQLPIEYVGKVQRFFWLTQLNVRLPEELENAGDVWVSLKLRGLPSNKALISVGASEQTEP